mgnify:CR=1 FL=1
MSGDDPAPGDRLRERAEQSRVKLWFLLEADRWLVTGIMLALVFAVFVVLSGVFAILQPQFAAYFGAVGILVSVASLFGALGGFGIGTILGIVGGSLCVAWVHPDDVEDEAELELGVRSKVTSAKTSVLTLLT